jgi:signal transduction histidine kinase
MRRELVYDGAVVCGAVAGAVFDTLGPQRSMRPLGGVTTAAMVGLSLLLLYRRRAPLVVGWIATGTAAAMGAVELAAPGTLLPAVPDPEAGPWLPAMAPFAAYAVVAFGRDRRGAWLALGALAASIVALVIVGSQPADLPWLGRYTVALMFIAVPALLGLYAAARRRLLETLVERAERAEREQHLIAEQARADERARLVAEMHDVVTHRVSLMVLRAGALRVTAADEATRSAAEDLRVTGCQALEELRDLVGLVREDADDGEVPAAPVPVPDLGPLAAESRAVGVDVELVEDGSRTLVSPVVARAAYRIVQEALTNVRKHAPGARVRVDVRYRPDGVRLTIHNTAPTGTTDPALAAAGSGTGLSGLGQRVDVIGGALHAGPYQGGFRLDATLPAYVPTVTRLEPAS